jgi:hypothetical protein
VYVRDARVQELPLVGGGEHDWAFLLGHFNLLAHDQGIGRSVHALGTLICLVAIISGVLVALQGPSQSDGDEEQKKFLNWMLERRRPG